MICDNCGTIFKRIAKGETNGTFERPPAEIRQWSKRGCYICWVIWKSVKEAPNRIQMLEAGAVVISFNVHRNEDSGSFYVRLDFRPNGYIDHLSLFNRLEIAKKLPNHTGDPVALDQARSWLSSCLTLHKKCKTPEKTKFLPPRLLDLRGADIRLTHTTPSMRVLEYATLSHCWGPNSETTLKLKGSNLDEFVTGIPTDNIPKTFLDAIVACRHLHIRFLWIDSLCIIQDDTEDWNNHVKLMHSIYEYAVVCLAASDSPNPNAGLFRKRLAPKIETPTITMDAGLFEGRFVITCDFREIYRYPSEPLSQRGWVLQEEVMSRRILHFRKDQLAWSCCDWNYKCEMYPNTTMVIKGNILGKLKLDSNQLPDPADFYDYVRAYSERSLTYPDTDKFAALAAIARYFTEALGDEYIAGFLSSTLPQSLLWYVIRDPVDTSPSTTFRAPTWSWASLDGVRTSWMNVYSMRCYADVINKTVDLLDSTNPFGPIKHATITISAPLVRLDNNGDWVVSRYGENLATLISTNWTHDGVRVFIYCDRESGIEERDGRLMGLIINASMEKHDGKGRCWFNMLLIEPTHSGLFKRIGICQAVAYWPTVELAQEAFDSLEKQEITLI